VSAGLTVEMVGMAASRCPAATGSVKFPRRGGRRAFV
jgi:hypothetical protein